MRRQRVLSFAVSCCIICSIICGRTYASGIWTVDGNVNPWADLEELERFGGGQTVSDGADQQPGDSAAASSAPESEPPALVAPPDVSAQQGGEEEDEPVFDGFGFSAELADGEVVQDAVSSDGISTMALSRNKSFSLSALSDSYVQYRFSYSGWSATSEKTSVLSAGDVIAEDFGTSTTTLISGSGSVSSAPGWTVTNPHYQSLSSQSHFFVSFNDLSGKFVNTISLGGTMITYISYSYSWRYVSYETYSCDYSSPLELTSCQLIVYEDGASVPRILKTYSPEMFTGALSGSFSDRESSSAGSTVGYRISFSSDDTFEVNSDVVRIGLRLIYSNRTNGTSAYCYTYSGYDLVPLSASVNVTAYLGSQFLTNYETDPVQETNGLLGGLIEWVKSIYEAVVSLPENFGKLLADIAQLPGKLLDGIKSLFIPSEEDMTELSDKYNGLFEEKLGFVYQMFTFIVDTFGDLVDELSSGNAYSFVFPGIRFPMNGETVEILPETPVSLDNALMDVLRPVLGTAVSIVCVFALVSTGFDMVVAVISGASYFAFLGNRKEEEK